jgi:hypothetical protein
MEVKTSVNFCEELWHKNSWVYSINGKAIQGLPIFKIKRLLENRNCASVTVSQVKALLS